MKSYIVILLICLTFFISVCSQGTEDKSSFNGTIGEEKAMGYEYTVIKDDRTYTWKIGHKNESMTMEEAPENKDDLLHFMEAVNESELAIMSLMIWGCYFVITFVVTLFLYIKNRKALKTRTGAVIIVAGAIGIYLTSEALFDLNTAYQDAQFYFLNLLHR